MAVSNEDLARLIVTLEVTTTKYYNAMKKAQQQTNTVASGIEKRLSNMSTNIDRTFSNLGSRLSNSLTGPLAGIGAALGVREIVRYADAWTEAGNKVAASGSIVGMQGRSLEDIRKLADEGRASFEDTIQLYSRLLRAAGDVADSEMDVARATNIVNKAFKAGGASTAEMQAGVIQLSQGLSSGVLQGDELRSIRENAPVLAEVMARYFKTTIGGLKELGSQGKLTSDEVFKAILSGEQQIEAAFGTTNRTIGEGFQLVQNRLIQYIGSADQSLGATAALTVGLNLLADNFDTVANGVIKLAALIAGALVGRSIVSMIGSIGDGVTALRTLNATFLDLRKNGASFGQIAGTVFGPLALIVGGAATLAFQSLAEQSLKASVNIKAVNEQADQIGIDFADTTQAIREAATATGNLADETDRLREAQKLSNSQAAVKSEQDLRGGTFLDNAAAALPAFAPDNSQLVSAFAIAQRAAQELFDGLDSQTDVFVTGKLKELAIGLRDSTMEATAVRKELTELSELKITDPIRDLLDATDRVALSLEKADAVNTFNGNAAAVEELNQKLIVSIQLQADLAGTRGEMALKDDLEDLIQKMIEGDSSAEETKAELERLAGTSATFGNYLPGLLSLLGNINAITSAATVAQQKLMDLANQPNTSKDLQTFRTADEASMAPIKEGNAFVAEQERRLALTEQQRDIEDEIARLRKKAGDDAIISEAKLTEIATANLAQKESGKKPKQTAEEKDTKKFFEDLSKEERSNEILQEELLLRQSLNPLINDYGLALEAAKKEQELLNAAEDAGVALTPDLEEKIKKIAELYATTTAEIAKTTEAQEKLKSTVEDWVGVTQNATRSFIDDLIEGKSAAESFGNVLSEIGSKLIDFGLDSLFNGGNGLGEGISGLIGSLFGISGKAGGGAVKKGQPYIVGEQRPELFVPNQSGVIIPRVPNQTSSSSSGTNVPISISIDATGADASGLAKVQAEIVKLKAELPYAIQSQVQQRKKKGW